MIINDTKSNDNKIASKILKVLSRKDMHITEIAKELNISSTCVSKHVRMLEDANLVERNILGRSHVISLINKNDKALNAKKEMTDLELYIIEHRFLV
jgi:predicted transcriptional regulator